MRALEAIFALVLALAGLCAGAGWYEGSKDPAGDPTPWFAAAIVFVGVAVLLILLLFVLAIRRDEAGLTRKAWELSRELLDFVADRAQDDPGRVPHWFGLPQDASEAERHRAFEMSTQALIAYSTETMSRYMVRFQARALKLFDDLKECNLVDSSQRHWFEHPTNPLGIQEVAKLLGVVGEGGTAANQSIWRKVRARL